MENKIKELDDTVKNLDVEIAELYKKAKSSKGTS